jgi:5-methylthioadenosine/S-adenosylhomocysteine deaminase
MDHSPFPASHPTEQEFILANLRIMPRFDRTLEMRNVWIKGNRIHAMPGDEELQHLRANLRIIDCSRLIGVPPLWNAHTHCALNFFRGLGQIPPPPSGLSMIETVLFPAEKNLTPELIAPLAYAHLVESLQSGVAGVFDHYYFVDGIGKALDRLGMRGFIGETVADLGGAHPGPAAWRRARTQIDGWSFSHRVRPMIAPHAADTTSRTLLTELAKFARQNRIPLHMHLSQTTGEYQRVQAREGQSPVQYANECGALFDQALLVHLVTASDDDLKLLAGSGATAGFCPTSQVIYEKLAPIDSFLRHRLPVVLGTDCAASNDSGNMLAEQKFAALMTKHARMPQDSETILRWTTWNPVALVGMQSELGEIKVGKLADMALFLDDFQFSPNHHFANNLVYSVESRNVRHMLIDGRWALWNQQITQANLNDLRAEYDAAVREILRRIEAP